MRARPPAPDRVALWWRGRAWTAEAVARLLVREGGRTAAEAARETGLSPVVVNRAAGLPGPLSLSPRDRQALAYLRLLGPSTVNELAAAVAIGASTARDVLHRLRHAELVARERTPHTEGDLWFVL